MRRLAWVCVAFLAASRGNSVRAQVVDVPDARIVRVEQWLKAVARHEPGIVDAPVELIGSWPARDIRVLWVDVTAIAMLIRDPLGSRFTLSGERQPPVPVRYTPNQLARLRVLACAAGGRLLTRPCMKLDAARQVDDELSRLAERAAAERMSTGDDNYTVRRGALLHTDIAMYVPATIEPFGAREMLGPQEVRFQTADGLGVELGQVAPHWELARAMISQIWPPGGKAPRPATDGMARLWYRATAAWMQDKEQHDTRHLDRARELFPSDYDILFLSATQHEVYADAQIQSALRTSVVPQGTHTDVNSEKPELRAADGLFRRAIAANPEAPEAHLRYGHVLLRLDRYADAARELEQALATTDDGLHRYYGQLFLGAAREGLREFESAREAYAEAARLFPGAQSPRIALSALARRRGDRSGAMTELDQVLRRGAPADATDRDDPWWHYFVDQARNADQLLADLRRPFRTNNTP
jgi:Tfp pilus assembly protein PilF